MTLALSLVCSSVLAAGADAGASLPTKAAMQGGFDALTTLVWLTSSSTPKATQADVIRAELKKLEALPHAFDGKQPNQEPGTVAIAALFNRYITTTRARFEAGEYENVGYRVRTLSGLCFACHTREPVAGDFKDAEKRFESLGLSGLERAQVLAATRQFDLAVTAYRGVLKSAPMGRDWSRALEDVVTLLVRVKGDPATAAAVLDDVAQRRDLPELTRRAVEAWRRDVKAWQQDKLDLNKASADQLFTKAEALMKQGGDVQLLRASAAVSQALTSKPTHAKRGEGLWLLAVAAGSVRSPLLWDLDLLYLEACVRENPKTPLARRCVERLEERVTLGFTGSAGTNIPSDEQQRLTELKGLAGVPR